MYIYIYRQSPIYISFSPLINPLSFSNSHPSNRVFFFVPIKSFRSSPFRTPAGASNGRSRACACIVSNLPFTFRSYCDGKFLQLAAGFDLAPFRKNEKTSRPFFPKTTVSWLSYHRVCQHSVQLSPLIRLVENCWISI